MRRKDSSLTRVVPAFEVIEKSPLNFWRHLQVISDGRFDVNPESVRLCAPFLYGSHEIDELDPNPKFLRWLIENADNANVLLKELAEKTKLTQTERKRYEIITNRKVREEALKELERNPFAKRKWYVLEGNTKPDVYVASDDFVLVVEGKRTEDSPTTSTTWMEGRDQLIRHMDGARTWEENHRMGRERRVFGLFIVDEDEPLYERKFKERDRFEEYFDPAYYQRSMPHRDLKDCELMMRGFLGVTTWQRLMGLYPEMPRFAKSDVVPA